MLTAEDVRRAYRKALGREPESDERIERCLAQYGTRLALDQAIRNSPEYRDRADLALRHHLALTDGYQAVYTLPHLDAEHARGTGDRCALIEAFVLQELRAGGLQHLSVLDVGCAQGYAGLYFADRGAHLVGIDVNRSNVQFCRALAAVSGIDGHFRALPFGPDAVALSRGYGVNAVFMLSVLHHVIVDLGVEVTRALLADLLDNGAILFCELAQRGEPVPFEWRDALPDDILSLFPEHARRHLLGEFDALNGLTRRPLYAIYSSRLEFREVSREHAFALGATRQAYMPELRLSSVEVEPVRIKTYRLSKDLFAKTIRITATNALEIQRMITSEVLTCHQLGCEGVTPALIGLSVASASVTLVFERVEGLSLASFAERANQELRVSLAIEIATLFARLRRSGLSWNDCRDHNVLVDNSARPYLIDFEAATFLPLEDDLRRIRWMLWHLCHTRDFAAEMERTGSLLTTDLPDVPARSSVRSWKKVLAALLPGAVSAGSPRA